MRNLPRCPVSVRHAEPTYLLSLDDEPYGPDKKLIEIIIAAASECVETDLSVVSSKMKGVKYPDIWPGEHYKILAALIKVIQPKVVVEIGTAEGLSALSILHYLPKDSILHTFDIIPYSLIANHVLSDIDFLDGRLVQHIADISTVDQFEYYYPILSSADLIFMDGPKDSLMEPATMKLFDQYSLPKEPIIVFDDIRLLNMLAVWRSIRKPKMDITSFGHWSGTGIVRWIK